MRGRGGATPRPLPGEGDRGQPRHERIRGRPAYARELPPRRLGRHHGAAVDRDRLRRRPAPCRDDRAAARRPAGRRVIQQAALYLSIADDLHTALLPVAGRPVAFRALAHAVRAGARSVGVPAIFRGTAVEAAIDASPRVRRAAVWLDHAELADVATLL